MHADVAVGISAAVIVKALFVIHTSYIPLHSHHVKQSSVQCMQMWWWASVPL